MHKLNTNFDEYLMENSQEAFRLEVKTEPEAVFQQAKWCGVVPGHRILDVGCGIGKTTSILHNLVQPGGSVTGIDFSTDRINYAKAHYGGLPGIEFFVCNFKEPLTHIGEFDLIWVRFILEYFLAESFDIVANISQVLKPGGVLCLLDLDYNCLTHYELPPKLSHFLNKIMKRLEETYNFDIYAGRKLYSYLYDHEYRNIEVNLVAHHLFFGGIKDGDVYNWMKKIEVNKDRVKDLLTEYPGGFDGFVIDFHKFLKDPRRFTYTPLIMCKGIKS